MASQFHSKFSVNLQQTKMKDQDLIDDTANPFGPPNRVKRNTNERKIYERRK